MSFPILFFAAGRGTRMAPLTNDRPKPLINVAGKTLLDHARTQAIGTSHQVVNVHTMADQIRSHLVGTDITISDETDLLRETGGGLRHALPHLGPGPVITMNTDAVWRGPNPVRALCDAWSDDMQALLLLVPPARAVGHKGAGDFAIGTDGKLTRSPGLIYTGVQITRTDWLADQTDPVFSLNIGWDLMAADGGLFGVVYDGWWCDVGQPSSIPLAEAMLTQHV